MNDNKYHSFTTKSALMLSKNVCTAPTSGKSVGNNLKSRTFCMA